MNARNPLRDSEHFRTEVLRIGGERVLIGVFPLAAGGQTASLVVLHELGFVCGCGVGRIVADVALADGRNPAKEMMAAGLAKSYAGRGHKNDLCPLD